MNNYRPVPNDVPERRGRTRQVTIAGAFGDGYNYLVEVGDGSPVPAASIAATSFDVGDVVQAEWWDNAHTWVLAGGSACETRAIVFVVSGALSVGAIPYRIHAPMALAITNVTCTVGTAPTGASLIVDVNVNGLTIFTTQANRPTVAAGAQDDLASAPDLVNVAQDDVLTIEIDQVGSTVTGSDLVVQVRFTCTAQAPAQAMVPEPGAGEPLPATMMAMFDVPIDTTGATDAAGQSNEGIA